MPGLRSLVVTSGSRSFQKEGEILLATVVGSYPQPDWLVDKEKLLGRSPPRARAQEIWRVDSMFLEQAQDDATILAIRDMELAGIDIVSDGEIRRESYSNRFAIALEGVDAENPGIAIGRTGKPISVPRVTSPIRWSKPILQRDAEFLRRNTNRRTKMTIPGPFTMTQLSQNDYYPDDESLALDLAAAVNQEIKALKSTGIDVVQIDEPWLQARPEKARKYGVEVINRALEGVNGPTVLHTCFGYAYTVKDKPGEYAFLTELNDCTVSQLSIEAAQPNLDLSVLRNIPKKTIILGVLNLALMELETPEVVAARIRTALKFVPSERLLAAPDCGMKYLPRAIAFGKLKALVEGAKIVRAELGS